MRFEYIAHYIGDEKTPQSVTKHSRETSELSSLFAGKIGLASLGKLEGLLHDLGKYSSDFQKYIR
jgi:CRISPR-associated endonuclease/helicase Cas3